MAARAYLYQYNILIVKRLNTDPPTVIVKKMLLKCVFSLREALAMELVLGHEPWQLRRRDGQARPPGCPALGRRCCGGARDQRRSPPGSVHAGAAVREQPGLRAGARGASQAPVPTAQSGLSSGAGDPCAGFLLACLQSHTLHFASSHRCHHINIPVTIAYCQTQFRKVPVCYKYFIVLEYAIYVTCPAKGIHYTVLSDCNSGIVTVGKN